MKNSWKWKIIGILTAVFSLCLFSGCQLKETLEDKKNKFDIVAEITYHANSKEASIGDTYVAEKTLYYKENSPALALAHSNDMSNVTSGKTNVVMNYDYNKYKLLGWYEPLLDGEGNIQKDDNDQVVLKDTPLNFSTLRLQKGDNYVVYAKWETLARVVVKLVCDEDAVLYSSNASDTKAYRNGDEIKDYAFDSNGERKYPSTFFSVKDSEYTFTEFYKTADVTLDNMMRQDGDSWPIRKPTEEGQDVVIYAHYVKGDYTVLRTPANVNTFFRNADKANSYYLLYDIDCSSLNNPVSPLTTFNAKLYGNGYTISNLNVSKTGVKEVALFGNVGANALLKDVTFENVTANYETDGKSDYAQVFWLFTSCANASAFDNVTFTNVAMNVTKKNPSTAIGNLYVNDVPVKTHYLYGGVNSDAEFASNGITYESLTVTVDGTAI